MLLLVGLGNPGPGHAGNRHNVGFMVADEIVRRHGFGAYRRRFQGDLSEGTVGGRKVLLLKPMTYMNRSGAAVRAAAAFYKIAPPDIVVIHDEIDLVPGKVRVKQGGGHGGHNGLRDISAHIGPDYWRVRIGVGHPGDKNLVEHYVLRDFAKEERQRMATVIDAVAEALPLLVAGDASGYMNRVALTVNPPKPKPPREAEPASGPQDRDGPAKESNGL